MEQHERALQELRDWTVANGGGLSIVFAGHSPSIVGNIPHPWQVTMANGRQSKELYHAYGITWQDAIIKCHQRWQDQKTGYMWEETKAETGFMTPEHWFKYQQEKSVSGG